MSNKPQEATMTTVEPRPPQEQEQDTEINPADVPPSPPAIKKGGFSRLGLLVLLGGVILLCGVLSFANSFGGSSSSSGDGWERAVENVDALGTVTAATAQARTAAANAGVTRRPASSGSSNGLREVRNDCGLCGTNSPVGGWESANGRALVLSDDGSFLAFFGDGTSMSGDWTRTGGRLCLSPDSGGRTCYDYEQKVDAMKLDEALYIRR